VRSDGDRSHRRGDTFEGVEHRQDAVRPFAQPGPGRTLALAWRRGSTLRVALQRIAETIRTALAQVVVKLS
jgi:hypothetical protein